MVVILSDNRGIKKLTKIKLHQESRIGLIRSFLVVVASWAITFYYCIKAMLVVLFNRESRPKIDRVIRQWSSALVRLIGLQIKVLGEFKPVEGRPVIVMCNHSSAYDIPVSFVAIDGSMRMLAKKELFRIPVFGRAMRMSDFVKIDRQNKEQARKDLEIARRKMEDGIIIWIAPEGTRSVDGTLLPLKKGGMHLAIQTQAIIVPVVIKDIHRVLPARSFRINMNQTVEFRIGKPIDAAEFGLESREALTNKVKQAMEELLAPPMGEFRGDLP
jgi:1-acyl-sn-glycerol-3-phosphate acyltransferase